MNTFALLDQAATRFGAAGAVYLGETQVCTWATLRDRALRLASAIRRAAEPGARIAIASENRPEYVEVLFAIWAAGCVAVPMNYKLHPREMSQILDDCAATWTFASPKIAPGLASATGCPVQVVGTSDYTELFGAAPANPRDGDPGDLAWLFYTSGTTGKSKGAMLSHRNLMAMTLAHLADIDSCDEQGSLVHAAPMSHGSGLYILPYLLRGARQVVPASAAFDPDELLDLCGHHPGCRVFLAPTMIERVLGTGRSRPANLRHIFYGGGPMYLDGIKRAMAALGPVFTQLYGQGESPMTITALPRRLHALDDTAVVTSVGFARSGVEVAVVDEAGAPVGSGQIGEIVCRGDVVMSGYWNNPGATADALRDGWLHTGDMGSLDEHGNLTLRDRCKDVVISGGTNIYPREVEEALLEHPGVAETSVIGVPDEQWGENVVAFVVCRPVNEVGPAELDAHLLERIARFKRPKRYVMVDELPKNSYGKVLKRELRNRLQR